MKAKPSESIQLVSALQGTELKKTEEKHLIYASTEVNRQMTFLLRNSQFSQKKVFNLHTIKINNVSQWIENSIA